MNKGNAYALASAIYAGTDGPIVDIDDLADRVYRTLAGTPWGYDELKADLYARLVEGLTAGTSFERAVNVIEAAMDQSLYDLGVHQ
jgi:hypothetical protein